MHRGFHSGGDTSSSYVKSVTYTSKKVKDAFGECVGNCNVLKTVLVWDGHHGDCGKLKTHMY